MTDRSELPTGRDTRWHLDLKESLSPPPPNRSQREDRRQEDDSNRTHSSTGTRTTVGSNLARTKTDRIDRSAKPTECDCRVRLQLGAQLTGAPLGYRFGSCCGIMPGGTMPGGAMPGGTMPGAIMPGGIACCCASMACCAAVACMVAISAAVWACMACR